MVIRRLLSRTLSISKSRFRLVIAGSLVVAIGLGGCAVIDDSPVLKRPTTVEVAPRPITPNDLVELRDIGGNAGSISVSPDGEWVAFQLQQGDAAAGRYLTGWFVASTSADSEEMTALGDGGDVMFWPGTGSRIEMKAQWSPCSNWIAYRVKMDDQIQLWRSRRDGSVQEQLTHNAANVSDFAWSSDGDKLFLEVGWSRSGKQQALQQEGESGYLLDDRFLAAVRPTPVFSEAAYDNAIDHGHVSGVWTYDIRTAEERPATDDERAHYEALTAVATLPHREEDRAVRHVVPFGGSGTVAWLKKEMSNSSEAAWAYVLHMATSDSTEIRCEAPECTGTIRYPMWSASGDEIYFFRFEGAKYFTVALYAWSPSNHAVRTILTTEDWITNCDTAVAKQLVCLHESATTPKKIVAIDPADGSIRTLVDPNPDFENIEFSHVETLDWKEAHSGAVAGGHLVYPIGFEKGKRYPMVIVQYTSRGFLRGGVGSEFPIHPFAANGFFVLSFDRPAARPKPADARDNLDWERLEWGEDLWERSVTLSALEVVVEQLDERGLIDPNRVGITGLSDGAETVWYAMIHSTHFAAAAASSGGWSPSWYYVITNQMAREAVYTRAAELLPPGTGGDDRWKRISPEFHADTIDVPILVQVADRELVMSAATIGSLMDAKKPIETYVYPDEYHNKWHPKHKLSVYERNVDWFNFWLRGVQDPDPAKAAQYGRWQNLREVHIANLEAVGQDYVLPMSQSQLTAQ